MAVDNKFTVTDLKEMQQWPLEHKIGEVLDYINVSYE